MKKFIVAAALLSVAASYSSAALLVGGWSFSDSLQTNSTFTSDVTDMTGATIYMDGTNGSDSFQQAEFPPGAQQIVGDNVAQNTDILSRPTVGDNYAQMSNSPAKSLLFVDNTYFGNERDANGLSFVIAADALNTGYYTDITLSYGAALLNSAGSTTITWEISYTGATSGFEQTVALTTTTALSSGGELESTSFTGSGTQFWIKGTLSDVTEGNAFLVDNLQVYGNAVPEPSTYAAIAGGLALAFVALRRRLRK
ncbi:PEP-CTERM sorting domain-containing protein [Ruficoccus sp. ZRK36]|uniref:PEP-CTERM sorting domain-containing protein n=1 Tax=Ruficoccus sp. ZRK36 TaxID=2866311 RepID=UPI001C72CF8E|nr:PEP-CTERM sorting domain-containing protein [Ruficoccus sp. ZRK36]QYY37380.1 PEP-CTERM sorting domain-containing protein [Ruficoccus sp. ZRK36]